MKLIKVALLAATAVVTAMAFIGASTASATPTWIGICKNAELLNCANLVKHPLLGKILALAGPGTFKSNFEISCTSGHGLSNAIQSQQNESFTGTLEELTFTGCSGGCNTVTVLTPQAVLLGMENATEGWKLKAVSARVNFSGCTFGVECEFEGTLDLPISMDATGAYVDPLGAKFELIKGSKLLCGVTGKWESGRTRFDWVLDDATPTRHLNVTPSLIGANLIPVS
jgi:hypothetical protein